MRASQLQIPPSGEALPRTSRERVPVPRAANVAANQRAAKRARVHPCGRNYLNV